MRKRPAARLFVFDESKRLLLFRYDWTRKDPNVSTHWTTPGGALDKGEAYKSAAQREFLEETGLGVQIGDDVFRRSATFQMGSGEWVQAHERYYLVRTQRFEIAPDLLENPTSQIVKSYRWWTLDEIHQSDEIIYPEQLTEILARVIACAKEKV